MLKKSVGLVGLVALLASVPFVLIRISSKYIFTQEVPDSPKSVEADCKTRNGVTYVAIIENNKISPTIISGHLCDKITILNKDAVVRRIAFGKHEQHVLYDGIEESLLTKDQSITFVLNQTGSFLYHDHEDDDVKAQFTVSQD